MKLYIVCAGFVLGACAFSTTAGQPPTGVDNADDVVPIGPRQPGGSLRNRTGIYLTIEGVRAERGKYESNTLLVDTVDGKKLDKPIPLVIRGAYIADASLTESNRQVSKHAILSTIAMAVGAVLIGNPQCIGYFSQYSILGCGWGVFVIGAVYHIATHLLRLKS
jgi:hypothetical protein